MSRILISTAVLLSLLASPAFSWRRDYAKPVDELMLMNDMELNAEAVSACMAAASLNGSVQKLSASGSNPFLQVEREEMLDASGYVLTIMRVVRVKHHGQDPWWMTEYVIATGRTSIEDCTNISLKYMEENKREAVKTQTPAKAGNKRKR